MSIATAADLPPYKADYLTNYELGWKTTWLRQQPALNGAVFDENWKDFQFAFLGPNALTIIAQRRQRGDPRRRDRPRVGR